MADYTSEMVTVRRMRFILCAPSNLTELDKMASAAIHAWKQDFPDAGLTDDAITVTTEDEAIVFSWEVRS